MKYDIHNGRIWFGKRSFALDLLYTIEPTFKFLAKWSRVVFDPAGKSFIETTTSVTVLANDHPLFSRISRRLPDLDLLSKVEKIEEKHLRDLRSKS